MRINQTGSQSVQSSETTATRKSKGPTKSSEENSVSGATTGGARADISSKARDMATAKAVATSAPDVREDRIAELRRRIDAGQYNVDPDAVAERMMKDHAQTAAIS